MARREETTGPARRFRTLEHRMIHGFEVPVATSLLSRLLGLTLLDRRRAPEGLLIPGCRSVPPYGMRFRLDLLFLAADGNPLVAVPEVGPGHRVRVPEADSVLELPSDWDMTTWDETVGAGSAECGR